MIDTLFIHKYQPVYFSDFEDDNPAIKIIKLIMSLNDELNIMLIGGASCGKTTLLNAVIREYYHGYTPQQYDENVLSINNLKEQGINYYRSDVKSFCQTCSNIKGKKKIVVLDDLDLINEQSQQVFRNCIDKYSHNVCFISSCTNAQKVIENIQSRLTIIKMQPLKRENIGEIIDKISKIESIQINDDAKEFIINISNNEVKIVINYMEKFKLLGEIITLDYAIQLCTNISFISFENYTNALLNKKLNDAIKIIYQIYDKGYSVMDILDNYFIFVKTTKILTEQQKYIIIPYLCKFITIFHNIHEDEIELALFTNNLLQNLYQ